MPSDIIRHAELENLCVAELRHIFIYNTIKPFHHSAFSWALTICLASKWVCGQAISTGIQIELHFHVPWRQTANKKIFLLGDKRIKYIHWGTQEVWESWEVMWDSSTSHAIFLCSWDLKIWHRVATPNRSIWELLHLRIAPFENRSIWELLHLRNAPFEKCSIWEMLHLRNATFEKHEDEDNSYILRRLQFQSRWSIQSYQNSDLYKKEQCAWKHSKS